MPQKFAKLMRSTRSRTISLLFFGLLTMLSCSKQPATLNPDERLKVLEAENAKLKADARAKFLETENARLKPERAIIGKWQDSHGSEDKAWEFLPNGTMILKRAVLKYSFIDSSRIKIEGGGREAFVLRIKIDGTQMEMIALDDPEHPMHFKLIPPVDNNPETAAKAEEKREEEKELAHAKQIGLALKLFTADHGHLPKTLSELTPDYLTMADQWLLVSSIATDKSRPSYELLRPGAPAQDILPETAVLRCRYTTKSGKRSVIYGDNSGKMLRDGEK